MVRDNSSPKPLFDEGQVRRALELIGENEPIGRKRLSDKLAVGEGSIRTILGRLKDEGLISSSPRGHVLTDEGKEKFAEEARKFIPIDMGDLTVGEVDVATMVRDASQEVNRGVEERDEAIKVGAEGATVLVCVGEDLRLAGSKEDVEEGLKSDLLEAFRPTEKDVIIVGTGSDEKKAERGALAAAEYLSGRAE